MRLCTKRIWKSLNQPATSRDKDIIKRCCAVAKVGTRLISWNMLRFPAENNKKWEIKYEIWKPDSSSATCVTWIGVTALVRSGFTCLLHMKCIKLKTLQSNTVAAVPPPPLPAPTSSSSLWSNSYNYVEAQAEKRLSDECVMKVTTYSTSLNK